MTLTHRLVIVAITELVFVAATRVVLHYFQWSSVEAESIRTVLRIVTALIYWWILKPLILSRSPELTSFKSPTLIFGFAPVPFYPGACGELPVDR